MADDTNYPVSVYDESQALAGPLVMLPLLRPRLKHGCEGGLFVVKRYRETNRKYQPYTLNEAMIEQGLVPYEGRRNRTYRDRAADDIVFVVKTASALISSNEACFAIKPGRFGSRIVTTDLGRAFYRCAKNGFTAARMQFPGYKFNPLFLLMEKHASDLLNLPSRMLLQDVGPLNERIARIRVEAGEAGFKHAMKNERRTMRENRAGLLADIAAIRRHYSRVIWVRIDLGYQAKCGPAGFEGMEISYDQVRADRTKFFRYLKRGQFKKSVLWHAWKQEGAVEKGPHTHVLVALDGRRLRKDAAIAYLMCKHWMDVVAPGAGVAFNCNARKSRRYRRVAIGRLHRNDDAGYEALQELVVNYMTKQDEFFRFDPPGDKGRAFGRSQLPSAIRKKVKAGETGKSANSAAKPG